MKSAVISALCLFGSASAFQTAQPQSRAITALAGSLDGTFGTGPETGNKCPPLGNFMADLSPRGQKWFQSAEIKNGRVAMVATVGYMVQKLGVHMPLYMGPSTGDWYLSESAGITFTDLSNASPLEAIQMIPLFGIYQIMFAAGWVELLAAYRQESDIPGNFGYDPLGFTKRPGGFNSQEITDLRMKEIKNGRLAMVTMAGWISEELIPGSFPVWPAGGGISLPSF